MTFIYQQLKKIQSQLQKKGKSLAVFYGEPFEVFNKILAENQITAVFTNHDYEPYARKRDLELYHLFKEYNIEFKTNFAPSLPTVTGNPSQIKQVFTNLITNAVDAMDGEGTLEITSFYDEKAEEVGVSFCDTGPGVPAEVQARIFDPFFSTKTGGMGLGLPISRSIVEAHGGEVQVESSLGSGASGGLLRGDVSDDSGPQFGRLRAGNGVRK